MTGLKLCQGEPSDSDFIKSEIQCQADLSSEVKITVLTPAAFARDETVDALRVPVHTVFHKFKACSRKKNLPWRKTVV